MPDGDTTSKDGKSIDLRVVRSGGVPPDDTPRVRGRIVPLFITLATVAPTRAA